jgi:hypothetical protein
MNDDISLSFVVLLIPVGLLLVIYEIKQIMKGKTSPLAWPEDKIYHRLGNSFMFWVYIAGGLLVGLLLIVYAAFSLLTRWK